MTSRKSKLLAGSLFTSLLLATTATAQTPGEANPPPAPGQAPAAAAVDELIVTGSRIRRNEYTSDAPITVITSETAALQGLVDTASLLQSQPVASGSYQQNTLMSGFVVDGGPGTQTISLRGLGAQRTLVLLDGRRLGPAGVRGTVGPVDLNVVPEAIIDRIEILKDGASSIYGSDAIAGVVNFITKKRLDEGLLSVYVSKPIEDGGEQFQISGAWGKTFERGFFSGSVIYDEDRELRIGDRDFLSCAEDRRYNPQTFERLDQIDPRTGKVKCYNVYTGVAQAATTYGGAFQYAQPGITYPGPAQGNNISVIAPALAAMGIVRAGRAGQPFTFPYLNYDSPLYARASAISPTQRYSLFVNGGYNITPGIELYGDLLLNRRESQQHGLQQMFPTVSASNPNNIFGPTLGVAALPIVAFKSDAEQTVDYARAVVGARGKLGDLPVVGGWDWDIFAQISQSDAEYQTDFIYLDRLNAVTGAQACNQALITISGGSCSTLPAGGIPFFSQRFLNGEFTAAEQAYLFGVSKGNTTYKQTALEGSITGDVFTLPAGPVSMALGFHIRQDEIDDTPDAQETAGNQYNLTSATPTRGKDTVREIFTELNVPVFQDLGLAGDLDVTLSGRLTDYDSYGSNSTYKLGFNWQLMPAVRVRGTHGTSYRAPALYELFIGNQTGFQSQIAIDPCVRYGLSSNDILKKNCAALGIDPEYAGGGSGAVIITGGGAGVLKAETSKATTFGLILTPNFETFDLSMALDYFEITIDDEVRRFGARNIVTQCLIKDFPNGPFCALVTRDPTDPDKRITQVNNSYVNVANQKSRGLDLEARYKQEFSLGTLTVDLQTTWQFEAVTQLLGLSEPEDFNGSTTEPDFSGQLEARFDRGDWTFYWVMDVIGKASDADQESFNFTDISQSSLYGPNYTKIYTEFQTYHTISMRKKMDDWTIQGGIRNLFDDPPPALSSNEGFRVGNAALNAYDFRGRRVFISIDRRF